MESQNKAILKHLKSGKKITAIDALNKFGCFRLASRINDLRKSIAISDKWVKKGKKKFKSYYIEK